MIEAEKHSAEASSTKTLKLTQTKTGGSTDPPLGTRYQDISRQPSTDMLTRQEGGTVSGGGGHTSTIHHIGSMIRARSLEGRVRPGTGQKMKMTPVMEKWLSAVSRKQEHPDEGRRNQGGGKGEGRRGK